nr:MAG TPA: EcAMP1-stabilized helical hairpin, antifungal peptide [Caudoviricetes sp.]
MFQPTPVSGRRKQYNTESRENQWRKQKCMNG